MIKNLTTVNLSVKESSFLNYLVRMDFNYKINQYDDLIKSIQRKIISDIKISIDESNLENKMKEIFLDNITNLLILEKSELIKKISSDYLKRCINEGCFDLYLEDKRRIPSKEDIQLKSFYYKETRDILINNKNPFKKDFHNVNIAVRRCVIKDAYTISQAEKERLIIIKKEKMARHMLSSESKKIHDFNKILTQLSLGKINCDIKDIRDILLSKFLEKDFLDMNQIDFSIDIVLKEESSTIYQELLENLQIIQKVINKRELYVIKMFTAIKENNCKLYFPNCEDKDIWNILEYKYSSKGYDLLMEKAYSIEKYKRPNFKDIEIVLNLNKRKYRFTLDEIYNESY